jgi:3-dehydroquinate dehydratase-1
MHLSFDEFVLAAATGDLTDAPRASEYADALEFRMDLADEPLARLTGYGGPLPVIATNRADWEGGQAPEAGRLAALTEAATHEMVAAVDIELATLRTTKGQEAAATARERGAAVVASVHDFEGTPPRSELRRLLHEAARRGDVGKLAVTATDPRDAAALLDATAVATDWGHRVATMAMGEVGSHTRAVAPAYGSKIGYAPVDAARATAPGQFDLATLARLIDAFE